MLDEEITSIKINTDEAAHLLLCILVPNRELGTPAVYGAYLGRQHQVERGGLWKQTDFQTVRDQFSSVAQSCLTLCDPMNGSTPGFPVHHQLPEPTQTHVHHVTDAMQPSHPLSSPSPPSFSPSQHQGLFPMSQSFASGGQNIGASTSASVLPMNIQN